MAKLIQICVPESHTRAWAAGFFDGEGTFHATVGSPMPNGEKRRYLVLTVSQKDPALLLHLREEFGVGNMTYQKATDHASECWKWVCQGSAAFYVGSLMWPWLGERKKGDFKRVLRAVRDSRVRFPVVNRRPPAVEFVGVV